MTTADNPNIKKRSFWRKKRYWFLAIAVALVFGVFKFDEGVTRLFGSITGQSSIGISDSMEPYELVFRTAHRPGIPLIESSKMPRLEWRLNIPRAFLTDIIGENGASSPDDGMFRQAYGNTNFRPHGGSFFAHMEAVYDPKTKRLTPVALADRTKLVDYAINIGLANDTATREIRQAANCVRGDDFSALMANSGKDRRNRACGKNYQRCEIYAHLDGWRVRLSVPRALYFADPLPVCSAIKAFLISHSVNRDSIE